ncbi:uncharacterized protein LOC112588025 [Harpegnathos saltator]|uniref:uncharacterized protein LOC112588025 n=1 Tax=Harpegnathos saltator TaxID=610380 RepID=UPI00058FF486|nr:uncharacterized protein LOC112588025 [Harpegnathos saltator]XP_025162314.1 uncharacterized protein LOC112588025 [Harpegnathos saltator]
MTSLSAGRAYPSIVTRKEAHGEGSSEPFLPKQQAPIDDFVYLPAYEPSSGNSYATEAAYGPSYNLTLNDTTGRGGIAENNEGNDVGEEGTYVTYCIVGTVILVIIGVIVGIIYFLIQHPKFARAMYRAIEADTTNGSATSVKKIMGIANQFGRMVTRISTTTSVPSNIQNDNDRDFQAGVYED